MLFSQNGAALVCSSFDNGLLVNARNVQPLSLIEKDSCLEYWYFGGVDSIVVSAVAVIQIRLLFDN
jgi:hypothetical protein